MDEVQSAIGVARAHLGRDHEMAAVLLNLERDLYVLMSELATLPENRSKLTPGKTLVTPEMIEALERLIDHHTGRLEALTDFVLPGESVIGAFLDLARTVARRAERHCLEVADPASQVLRYLNRLSDLLWVLARVQDGTAHLAKSPPTQEQP